MGMQIIYCLYLYLSISLFIIDYMKKPAFFLFTLGFLFLAACQNNQATKTDAPTDAPDKMPPSQLKVVATLYPLAEFAQQVGGEKAEVLNLIPAGTEPHDFEPKPQDIVKIQAAQVLLLNGAGLDNWVKTIIESRKGQTVITMSEHFELLKSTHDENEESAVQEKGSAEAMEANFSKKEQRDDPHFWLDPVYAQKEIEIIRDAFSAADPENSSYYKKNAANFIEKLNALHQKFIKNLKICEKKEIITSHNAFAYLTKRYGIIQISISGISPEAEVPPRTLQEIAKVAREKKLRYIYFETLASPKLAETLAEEAGAQILVLNPVEGLTKDELSAGKNYLNIMEENLDNLRKGLECI